MAEKKRRVNLYLDADVYGRARELTRTVPGASVSGLVNELLAEALPAIEQLVNMAKEGNREAQAEMMSRLLADQILSLSGSGSELIHTIRKSGSEGNE